jgi:hypothetical protein
MNRVGCSSRSSSGLLVNVASSMADRSSKDSSEEMLLIVGVGGSGWRFSMASRGKDIHGDRKSLRLNMYVIERVGDVESSDSAKVRSQASVVTDKEWPRTRRDAAQRRLPSSFWRARLRSSESSDLRPASRPRNGDIMYSHKSRRGM